MRNAIEKGSVIATNDPTPTDWSYRRAYANTNGKYGKSGVMMLVVESPTRNAACVHSGEMPSGISIGTRIGAMNAHFADADPIIRSRTTVNITIARISENLGN